MEIEQKRGEALVIVGPQGSGKSTLARQIAMNAGGRWRETDAWRLEGPFGLGEELADQPDTLIVDGIPKGDKIIERLKAFITSDRAVIELPHQQPRAVKTPNFIFCIDERDFRPSYRGDRRFRVVHI